MLRQGSSRSFCSMKPTWSFGPFTRWSLTSTSPVVGW
jgi:hypothetical protein